MTSKLDKVISVTYGASLRRGGWEATLRIGDDGDALADWQVVEIWQRDLWADVDLDFFDEGWKRPMVGYALPKEIKRDWKRGDFDVLVATSHRMLRNMECQYIAFLEVNGGAEDNHILTNLTLGHMIKHVLDSHTNIIFDAGTNPEGWAGYSGVDVTVGGRFTWFGLGRERGLVKIWPTITNFAKAYGLITYFDKGDDLYWGKHPMFAPPASVVTLGEDFWHSIKIRKLGQEQRVKQAHITGDKDDGTTLLVGTYPDPLDLPDTNWYYGNDVFGRIRCNEQAELDAVAERIQRFANRDYDVEIETWGLWDFELADRVEITYANEADGIDWGNKSFYVESIQVTLDLKRRRKKTRLVLNAGVGEEE